MGSVEREIQVYYEVNKKLLYPIQTKEWKKKKKKPGHVEVDVAAWKPYRSFAALFFCLSARATATCNSQLLTTPKKSLAEILTNKIVILT